MHVCSACGTRFSNEMRFCPHDGQPLQEITEESETLIDPLVGTVVDGRYLIESVLGEGGMGVVYLATHTALNKRFAVKVLRGEIARDEETMRRFVREAQSSSAIGHANIVDISDFGKLADGTAYFVMEHLDGEPLTDRIRRGAMPADEVLHICTQIAEALGAAHGRGIVHRDLKPDNIFLIRRGGDDRFVKILDFGIAKVGGANAKLTRTGMIFGTPHYMSPEQAAGQSVDSRTDIYALGVILFEMLTGQVPFDGDTFMGILGKHMFDPPPKPSDVVGELGDSGGIEPLVLKALSKKPEDRYASMDEVLADVAKLRAGQTVTAPLSAAVQPPVAYGDPSIGDEDPIASSRAPLFVIAGFVALLIVGGGVGAWVALQQEDDASAALAVSAADTTDATAVVAANSEPDPEQAEPGPSEDAAGGEARPDTPARPVTLLASEPAGALVLVDGAIIGNTPLEVERPTDGSLLVEIRQRGFESQTVSLSARSPGHLEVGLEPTRSTTRTHRRHRPAPVMTEEPEPAMEPVSRMMGHPGIAPDVVDPWQ